MSILTDKQIRLLESLDSKILECKRCSLHKGGVCKPYWTPNSQFAIIGEAPGKNEVEQGEPFVGTAGNHLWEIMSEYNYSKDQFLIINSANCRPTDGKKNLKPKKEHLQTCRKWIELYMKVVKPHRVLLLGNYATDTILNENSGIISKNGTYVENEEFGTTFYRSVHPSMCIYRGNEGKNLLRTGIKIFAMWG